MTTYMQLLLLWINNFSSKTQKGINQSHATRLLKKNGKNKLNFFDSTSYFDLCRDFFGGFGIILWIGTFIFIFAYVITYIFENEYLTEYLWLGIFLAVFNVLNSFFSIYQVRSFKRTILVDRIHIMQFHVSIEWKNSGDCEQLQIKSHSNYNSDTWRAKI